jgi:hypothetical protein
MEFKDKINKNQTGFITPKAYFEGFESRLFQKLSEQNTTPNSILPETSGLEIPEAYFNTVEKAIFERTINQKKTKVVSLWYYKIAKVAAILLLIITGYGILQTTYKTNQQTDRFSTVSEEDLEIYIENNILPYSEMRNLFMEEGEFEIADNAINELDNEVILRYLDNELDDLDLLDE